MGDFKVIDLFGGAMMASVPSTFEDVSDIRQVPDNQEVFLDKQGFSSIVFDILERVPQPDLEALKYHLHDIVEEDADRTKVWTTSEAHFSKLPKGTTAFTLLATSPPGEKQRGRPNEPDIVGILLTLVRLEAQKTDVVITINVPHLPDQYDKDRLDPAAGKYGPLLEAGMKVREEVLKTFEVKDWELFVQD